ncbi:MAG: O-antigen ligase family protein [Acidobacteriota bacterium]|nr:O-antigen ligase family protein [Acidobacteriota bacterium]
MMKDIESGTRQTGTRILLYAILAGLFFEAQPYSVTLLGVRLRISLILAVIGIAAIAYGILRSGVPPRFAVADKFLWLYMGVNLVSLVMSPDKLRSVKIAVLLGVLILLYHLVVILASRPKIFDEAIHVFLSIGLIQIGFGLYQVAAGMLRHFFGWNWPVGHLGLFQAWFIGAPWGRPYGTLVEPDWYGAVCLYYAVVFLALAYSREEKKIFYRFGAAASLAGLFFSFVRAAWVGFLAGILFLVLFRCKASGLRLHPAGLAKAAAGALILFSLFTLVSPTFQTIVQRRFFPQGEVERYRMLTIRAHVAKNAWSQFLESPIMGHGPGTPVRNHSFNHSIIMTALVDTGVVGLAALLAWLGVFFHKGLKKIPEITPGRQPLALGLLAGIAGLLFSYIFTTGLWIPFTWVFLAFFTAAVGTAKTPNASTR